MFFYLLFFCWVLDIIYTEFHYFFNLCYPLKASLLRVAPKYARRYRTKKKKKIFYSRDKLKQLKKKTLNYHKILFKKSRNRPQFFTHFVQHTGYSNNWNYVLQLYFHRFNSKEVRQYYHRKHIKKLKFRRFHNAVIVLLPFIWFFVFYPTVCEASQLLKGFLCFNYF